MPIAKPKREKPADMKRRHIDTLAQALQPGRPIEARALATQAEASLRYAELSAAVYAVVPGRQKAKNIGALLDAAVKAVAAKIRKRGK